MTHVQFLHRLIQDMGKYAIFHFEHDPPAEGEEPIEPREDLYLPKALKAHVRGCVAHLRDCNYLHAFDHYVGYTNPSRQFEAAIRLSLMEVAHECSDKHMRFLRECTMHFLAASILRRLGMRDAPEIVADAMYRAATATTHSKKLQLWGRDIECNVTNDHETNGTENHDESNAHDKTNGNDEKDDDEIDHQCCYSATSLKKTS